MHELELWKPDGRRLVLYSRRPIERTVAAPTPASRAHEPNPHFRWHPLRGEWISYAPHRQERTFLPPPEYNPLLPSDDGAVPTELPVGDYDIAVFDNLFPTMSFAAHDPPAEIVPTAPALGHCEVVVFTQDPRSSLAALPLEHIELLIEVWGQRTLALGRHDGIRYVLPFENRGPEVGVTLEHPHGQIYAYPFVPPVPGRMHELELEHLLKKGSTLLQTLVEQEMRAATRMIYAGDHAVAFVPAWARYPYEAWIAPRIAAPDFTSLSVPQRADLARAIKTTLMKFDGLWNRPMPYIMAWYQAPLDDSPRRAYHLHAECFPAYRMPGRLKYLAGTEVGAGMFANDTLPEAKARELQDVVVNV
ncbi:MAG: galactose-1-phosphate uridylyltransferase [Acidobacteriota bacterium]|nr:galactose-1-phosphate uridylyltransferase [Acidobacteriota bacterium]